MKNRILLTSILAIALFLLGNMQVMAQNNTGASLQVKQKTETANQGENSEIKVQNNVQVQNLDNPDQGDSTSTQLREQLKTQEKLQDGSGAGDQVKNQGEDKALQNNVQAENQLQNKSAAEIAQERRSQVANAVQAMLQVADKNKGIGQQVRTIAQSQIQNQEKLENSLQKIQSRNGLVKFLIGPNYTEINNAKNMLAQNLEQIQQLNQVKTELTNKGDQQILTEQIQLLAQANQEIESSLGSSGKGFSLLGWVFRMFTK